MDNNELVKGSLVLLILTNVFNLLNLLFQVFVAHKLTLESYGIFTALFSIVYICGIFSESTQLIVTKRVARMKSKNEVDGLFLSSLRASFFVSLIFFVVYSIILFIANAALQIPVSLILFNGLIIIFSLTSPVVRGVLQGQKRFTSLGINIILEGLVKLVLGIAALIIGWEIYGVYGAVIISMALPIVYGIFRQIRPSSRIAVQRIPLFSVLKLDVVIIMACITLFFMLDVFIARAVLSPTDAGYYAIASTIAKMAFIGTQPISRAMLSHVASAKGISQAKAIFKRSLLMLSALLAIGIIISFLLSNLLVFLFSGAGKESAASVLGIVFLAVSMVSLANLYLFYRIAINKTRRYLWLSVFLVLLLCFLLLAPATLMGFAAAYLFATIIFLIGSILILRW